ncbi:MAG: putative inorganic carbon transporter subunit DabA, partial [Bacteroidia bacterium]
MKTENSFIEEKEIFANGKTNSSFDEHKVLHDLKHYLPAQAPLKDFIHHNTLHAFQNLPFHEGLRSASKIFGYKVSLTLDEYREYYHSGKIREDILDRIVSEKKGAGHLKEWKEKLLTRKYDTELVPRIGELRSGWKAFKVDLDSLVHPILFRVLCSYLDQGISIWQFPVENQGFLASIREIEKNSFTSFFKSSRAKKLLLEGDCSLAALLKTLVGDESLYATYLFDQQFAHQGWSGMVSAVELQPETLLDTKKITLHDLITFELLLEIDALDFELGKRWEPLSTKIKHRPSDLFALVPETELNEVFVLWQEAYEWSYYDEVLSAIKNHKTPAPGKNPPSFQAMFCIDDRECSLRRYLENTDPDCETFGTPGFFSVEFFFQPEGGKFYTKLCPAPVTPKYLIKEAETKSKRAKDVHFSKTSHSFFRGWLISQTLGFESAFRLFLNIFKPAMSPATAHSFKHMDKFSKLTIENTDVTNRENDLQVGFTIEEMTNRVESLLKSIGLVKNFSSLVYVVGHGSSSVNNPHFAAYDCGACCGRPGSVNARVVCYMANHPKVRAMLAARGLVIPETTQFVGGLHDTTR